MKNVTVPKIYALAFGLFLGLCIWKFGNPVILDHKISAPNTATEWLIEPWPPHWAPLILMPFFVVGTFLAAQKRIHPPANRWLVWLPLAWLGWQFFSAGTSVDATLTAATLWQYAGCVACYFLGTFLLARENLLRCILPGVLAAFTFCLIRAVDQRAIEFPAERQAMIEGQRTGWTNFPPENIASMKNDGVIITTNGADVVNPVILKKMEKGRAYGTLVYPNALAGIILLLWPLALALAVGATKKLKPPIRFAAVALAIFLGGAAFFATGSKLGWLIGILLIGLFLLRLDWSKKLKFAAVAAVLFFGLGIFAVRFHSYFSAGATSAGARFDYWRAAVQITQTHPLTGTGPGTFQRPYAQLKSPDAEMARLTHNDFLEQFSDSGIPGGLAYAGWIFLALAVAGKKFWRSADVFTFAIFAGVLAWFVQGLGEFSLFIPALAWTAFALLGFLIGEREGLARRAK
jgi:hypothetical protein